MTTLQMENEGRHGAPAQAQFQFMSAHRCVRASGVAERVSVPVDPHGQGDGQFQLAVSAALARARAAGIERPIVIGAIPFDLRQPSCLAVPLRHEFYERAPAAAAPARAPEAPLVLSARSFPDELRFKQSVRQAIANFGLSDIRKAVLARIFEVELDERVDVARTFARLTAQNPSGYHFRLPLFDGSELIGASPELLVRKHAGRIYSNPLAGSARRHSDPLRDREVSAALLQSGKDAYEHRLVIEDIARVLQPLCGALEIPAQPSLLSTAAMWHLSTRIEGVLADDAMSALQLACRLHPTPAVCGFPTGLARKLISLVEPFERGMFAGMVGWCDADGNGEWVVTIRCGRVHQRRIQLFAGAGIVADSCPESEWAETQAKLQTMLRALGVELPQAEALGEAA
ncbi:isochorismate synthase [Janthinobacterium sp.]|uniref:isochorismate synthase n=1 Tax=Janthinobacterium sp. TaxID=1871054 RepID=UPI00293D64AA|nr:isochorismate synthase [Janthinobacterium sp.]